MKRFTTTILATGILAIIIAPLSPAVSAQTKPGASAPAAVANVGQALEIGPPVVTIKADPGQTVKAQINLRDISPSKLVVTNEINDFVADGEDGTPKILLNEAEPSPYSMKSWVAPLPKFTLVPKQIQQLSVTIKVPLNAAPGGYYSVIRFTGIPPDLDGTGVALNASLGALVLLKVNGDVKENLLTEQLAVSKNGKVDWLFESVPLTFVERIKNTGNIHEQPVGQVEITDMFGKKVAAVNVNLPIRNILPGSIRKFEQPLDKSVIGDRQLFGKYTAVMNLTYGDKKQTVTSTVTFWVIPYRLIAIIVIALIVGFSLLYFGIRRYNRYIINQARR